jgi:hypothetical protein
MITHGTTGDWIVWAFMLAAGLGAAFGSYRMGKLAGGPDGEVLDVFYGGLMIGFLLISLLIFIHAPFYVEITSR